MMLPPRARAPKPYQGDVLPFNTSHLFNVMDAALRTKIIWGVIAMCAGSFALKTCNDSRVAEEEAQQQQLFRKKNVTPKLKEVNDATAPRSASSASPFDAADLLTKLSDYDKRTAAQRRELEEIFAFLQEKQGAELPENVFKQWENQLARLQRGKTGLDAQQEEAQGIYDAQLQQWLAAAAQTQDIKTHADELDALATALQDLQKTAERRRSGLDRDGVAYAGYTMDIKRIKKRLKLIEEKKAEWEAATKAAVEARAAVVTDTGEINRDGEPIRKAEELLARILVDPEGDAESLTAPTILPAPPPPPFVPDIRIVTTGDLADSLLEPLVNQWLKTRKATPMEGGNTFTWNVADENTREIEVKVPEKMQGADKGVLRIRVTTETNGSSVFTHLLAGGDADLVLTGRKMSKQMEGMWLPQGKTLEMMDPAGKGRAYRTRICSDALLFFRGSDMDLETVSTHVLKKTPKVLSMDDAGRMEAAALFGQTAGAADLRAKTAGKTSAAITNEHPNHLFLGTWHQDGVNHNPGRALSASSEAALSYSTCWEDEAVLKNIPAEYRAVAAGCVPTDDSIKSGQYAFSYSITFYRATQNTPKAAAAVDLMSYAGDVTNAEVGELVRLRGFAPMQFELNKPDNTLSDKDLPLAKVIRQMESSGLDMGYDDSCSWVYGVRIPIPLYYAVGSVTSDGEKAVEIDPDSRYYTEAQGLQLINKLVQGKKACLVLVGHADPQWGKKMDTSKDSWRKNLALSEERAKSVYKTLFSESFGGNDKLGKVQLGTSWARPAADLYLNKSVEEQESALDRCRRVDVFLIFPMTAE